MRQPDLDPAQASCRLGFVFAASCERGAQGGVISGHVIQQFNLVCTALMRLCCLQGEAISQNDEPAE